MRPHRWTRSKAVHIFGRPPVCSTCEGERSTPALHNALFPDESLGRSWNIKFLQGNPLCYLETSLCLLSPKASLTLLSGFNGPLNALFLYLRTFVILHIVFLHITDVMQPPSRNSVGFVHCIVLGLKRRMHLIVLQELCLFVGGLAVLLSAL